MPNITTEWDYNLKQEVFKVTGDKGYVHQTTVMLSERNEAHGITSIEYYTASFTLNVLRDIGNGYIVFYDNGDAIPFTIDDEEYTQYLWTEQSGKKKVKLNLTYGITHNITAKYLGNKNGLPSQSKPVPVYNVMPDVFGSKLTKTSAGKQFDDKTNISFDLRFWIGKATSFSQTKPVKIFVDGDEKTTVNFIFPPLQKQITQTINLSVATEGMHTIKCEFYGDEYSFSSETDFQISVGYNLEFIEYPNKFIVSDELDSYYAENNQFKVQVSDWFGNAPEGTVSATSDYAIPSATLDSDGIATFTADDGFGDTGCTVTYQNSTKSLDSIPTLQINEISTSVNPKYASRKTAATITSSIINYEWLTTKTDNIKDVLMIFKVGDTYSTPVLTDADGTASTGYVSTSKSNFTVDSKAGSSDWESVDVETVTQYWNAKPYIYVDRQYEMHGNSSMADYSTGFKITLSPSGFGYLALGNGKDTFGNYDITFDIVQGRKNSKLMLFNWNNRNGHYNANINWDYWGKSSRIKNWSSGKVRITKRSNHIQIYRNNDIYDDYYHVSSDCPLIMWQSMNSKDTSFTFNNFKFKEV